MEENTLTQDIQATEVEIPTSETSNDSTSADTTEKEITALPYQFIFDAIYSNAKSLGQVVFVDQNKVDGTVSNTISVIRMLTNGEKQFFKITVDETVELTLKK